MRSPGAATHGRLERVVISLEPSRSHSNGLRGPDVPPDAQESHFPAPKPSDPRGGSRKGASAPLRRFLGSGTASSTIGRPRVTTSPPGGALGSVPAPAGGPARRSRHGSMQGPRRGRDRDTTGVDAPVRDRDGQGAHWMDDAERRADFTAYVAAREQPLARLAYLLTGNRDEAEDQLQTLQTPADLAGRARQGRQPRSCRTGPSECRARGLSPRAGCARRGNGSPRAGAAPARSRRSPPRRTRRSR